ncbi:Dyp-type peroxidase [Streptomyces bluensis]|uniref:Dyp-type peroxidase n=1 Tax=Streptomyces bluensis TaxID=33897 RepID=UPI00167650DC|nr:Dyp-type peroxidase [Streptomyces bluensis]
MTTDSTRLGESGTEQRPLRRRALVRGTAAVVAGGITGYVVGARERPATSLSGVTRAGVSRAGLSPAPGAVAVSARGGRQAGVDRPVQPQQHVALSVYDLPGAGHSDSPGSDFVRRSGRLVAELGTRVLTLTARDGDAALGGLPPGDLTVTVGVGPRVVAAVDGDLPGARELPGFAREEMPDSVRGGDLMIQVCASDPQVVTLADGALRAWLQEQSTVPRWTQHGFRHPAPPTRAGQAGQPVPVRNLLGFLDGIVVPRSGRELDREVWLPAPARVRGGTVAVVRRLRLDVARFLAQGLAQQERAIGRRREDGAPLSGGGPDAPLDLGAKSPQGRYLLPAMAHARRANPGGTGSGLMLRRGYSYANGPEDRGLLFICFQRELRTFVATQQRLDDGDDLSSFAMATASGTFLVLPGFTGTRPLGAALFS